MAQSWSGTGLPPAAAARMAEIAGSGTWGSAVSVDEFAAIRSAGFEPAGQVLGAAVYNIGDAGSESCPAGEQASVLGRLASGRAAAILSLDPEGRQAALPAAGTVPGLGPALTRLGE